MTFSTLSREAPRLQRGPTGDVIEWKSEHLSSSLSPLLCGCEIQAPCALLTWECRKDGVWERIYKL